MDAEARGGPLDKIGLDIAIVLGRARMPIHQLLRMGRGAVIELDAADEDEVEILANDMPVARGVLVVTGSAISVEIKSLLRRPTGDMLDTTDPEGSA